MAGIFEIVKLTNEQEAIVNSSGDIKINAVAGSGKTTTLIAYAQARKEGRILYIAFNKSVKVEAERKFRQLKIDNVRVETAHGLAHSYIVQGSGYKVKKDVYRTTEIAEILGLPTASNMKHAEYVLANHINKFITYFRNSNKARVEDLDYEDVVFEPEAIKFAKNFKSLILRYTRILLAKMDKGEIEILHDFYLKKFQQMKPQLPYDYILFDEGQDASEAMLDVFLAQKGTKVIVGDTHQQIYAWRFAINSLEKVDYPVFHLSSSFRFSNEIASLATRILKWKKHLGLDGRVIINGYGDSEDTKMKAVLARTNMGLLIKAIELLIEKETIKTLYFEGRFERYTYADEGASIYDVLNLHLGKLAHINDKLIASMANMAELEDYIDKTEDSQLRMIVDVVKKYGELLPEYINTIKKNHIANDDKNKVDMIFSTVHKCKGMEYDEVTLVDDFITEEKLKKFVKDIGLKKLNLSKLCEEINLLYVAVTRTKNILNIPVELLPRAGVRVIAGGVEEEK